MPRASHYLEGHWVRMWPGAVVMANPRRRMVVVCHRPRAQRGTSCCAVTGGESHFSTKFFKKPYSRTPVFYRVGRGQKLP